MKIGVIGAGRIGKVHIRNISLFVPELTIKTVADPFMNEKTAAYVKQFGIENVTKEADDILNDPEIEAVVIASSTNTHAKFIIESAKAGKNIFCEKPIDYDIDKIKKLLALVEEKGVKFQVGFNRYRIAPDKADGIYDIASGDSVIASIRMKKGLGVIEGIYVNGIPLEASSNGAAMEAARSERQGGGETRSSGRSRIV